MERGDDHVLNMTNNFGELYKVVVARREDVDTVNESRSVKCTRKVFIGLAATDSDWLAD
ncbi:hypothetical protein C8R44DRAFT_878770 [Mycena epipterygia]|nr:hypothetical protein C8R44DRAFT_878770 [Mycena epipterygia]